MTAHAESLADRLLAEQRRKLARWLREWNTERILRAVPDEDEAEPAPGAAAAAGRAWSAVGRSGASCPSLCVGDIRLLRPLPDSPARRRPLYVALLEAREDGRFLVAPFSRFAHPAVPGEWQTGLKAPALRVLCVWNSRTVPAASLRASWRAAVLRRTALSKALEILRTMCDGTPPVSTPPDVGPPVLHPRDPRLTYQEEEASDFEEHLAAAAHLPDRTLPSGAGRGLVYDQGPAELRMAAEETPAYGAAAAVRRKRRGAGQGREQRRPSAEENGSSE